MLKGSGRNRFGGAWTELKLDAISYYLDFYTRALAQKPTPSAPFQLWYVDAFAGSGSRVAKVTKAGDFEFGETAVVEEEVEVAGSTKRALELEKPFSRYVFVEARAGRAKRLAEMRGEFPALDIEVRKGDANEELIQLFSSPPWRDQRQGRGPLRAVVFLDPFAMAVRWKTLQTLAATAAVDVWYLFPLNATVRQLARDMNAVDAAKALSLDEIFGTSEWRDELYREEVEYDLFGQEEKTTVRHASQRQIEAYAVRRLRALFNYVSPPLPLVNSGGAQLFSLFCLSASTSPQAVALIERGVKAVLKRYS